MQPMRKIAVILLVLFALVQAGPAVTALFSPSVPVFLVDEEKADDKTETEQKLKKDYTCFADHITAFSRELNTAFHLAEKILAAPCIEKNTPPPNFS